MSACRFIASDFPLKVFLPEKDYPISINIEGDAISIDDGGADDNYFLKDFPDVSLYTDKKHGVSLEWRYTNGRAKRIIDYVRDALKDADEVEIWLVWLLGYWEFEERPIIHRRKISINDMTEDDVKAIDSADVWKKEDKNYPERPSFYCLTVTR